MVSRRAGSGDKIFLLEFLRSEGLLDWLNPELSHALLIFRKDFVRNHPEAVTNIIMRNSLKKALQMPTDFQEMDFPQYDLPPLVSLDLLEEMQGLLLPYKEIGRKVDLRLSIDNSFVNKVCEELK